MKTRSFLFISILLPVFGIVFLLTSSTIQAATRTASVSGNWSSTTTWGGAAVPTSGDAVTINSGITVTVDMAAQCASLSFAAVITNSSVTISGSNSLSVTGDITMPRPSNNRSCTVSVNAGTLTCGSITMSATTGTTRTDNLSISTGTATVSGNITSGTTACIFTITGAGTLNIGGTIGTPTLTLAATSTVNYTSGSAQTIVPVTYGNLGLSGAGAKTIASVTTVTVAGNFTNSANFTVTEGTSTTDTWFSVAGNFTNSGNFTELGPYYSRFLLNGTAGAQTFTNTGTVTAGLCEFGLANSAGVTISSSSNPFAITRANLFYGTVTNSAKITLGTGGTSDAAVQRGVSANTFPAGSFDVAPSFNIGTGGYSLLYDNGSVAYSLGVEVPFSLSTDFLYIFDAADISLSSALTITTELNFYGGTGTPTLRIGANTLTLGGMITYTVASSFNGGLTSNLVIDGGTTLNGITGGLNNFTINQNTALGGAVTVNGTLALNNGLLINGSYLTMATGTTISRSAGSLVSAPTFAGTVNLVYSGSLPLTTGKELPTGSSVLNNFTTNTGGVTQYAWSTSTTNVLTDAFPNLTSWTGNKGTTQGNFNTVASANAGGTSPEAEFIGSTSAHGTTPYYIYRGPVNTTGYAQVNVTFKTSSTGVYTPNVTSYLKLQSSTSASGPWHDVWSYTYTAALAAQTVSIPGYTTDVGGNMYFQFAFEGDYYVLDYWYFDDLVVDGVTVIPVPSSATINGTLNLTNGPYTVGTTGSLKVLGTTIMNGTDCLVLKSGSTGTASFIDNGFSGSGTARVERYLSTDIYHYISSPISNATAGIFFNDYLMTSDPSTSSGWGSWITNTSTPLQVMRGYACWKPSTNSSSEAFSGTLNTGSQSISLNRNASDPWAGWHLVGNPYPSTLDLASAGITWNNFEPTAYFWNGSVYLAYPTTGGYGTHTQYAPPEQGFFAHIVNTFSGSTTLTMTNAARVHTTEAFLKDAPVLRNSLMITAQGDANPYFDKMTVQFNADATAGYDPGYDAYKLAGINEAPQVYTLIGTTQVGCNSLPFEQKNMVIPMGFSCGLAGNFTLLAEDLGTFEDAISIRLEDLKLNVTQNLRTNPVYNFTYATTDDPNRFVLHFDDPTLGGLTAQNIAPVKIYSFGNTVYVLSQDGNLTDATVFVYDLIGRERCHMPLSNQTLSRISPGVPEGYYLVRVVTGSENYTAKVYLKNQ